MQKQRHHAGAVVAFRIVYHRPEHARARAVRRRRRVMVGCGGAAQFRFQPQVKRGFGRERKQRRQLGAQLDVELAVDVDHLLVGGKRAELVLRRDPVRQAAGRPGVAHFRPHESELAFDARHFRQAGRVDVIRRHAGRGLAGDPCQVPVHAARQRAPAAAGARRRNVVGFEKRRQPRQRRRQLGIDAGTVGSSQAFLVGGGKRAWEVADRRVENARFGRGADQLLELRQAR